jgi:hypothetical protein
MDRRNSVNYRIIFMTRRLAYNVVPASLSRTTTANYVQPNVVTNFPYNVTYVAGNLWTGDFQNPNAFKINPTTALEIDSVGTSPISGTRSTRSDGTYVYLCQTNANDGGLTPYGGYVVIINPSTDTVVGKINRSAVGRVRDIAFDGSGNLFLNIVINGGGGNPPCQIEKFSLATVLASYPTPVTSPTATFTISSTHIEYLTYGFGYLWGSDGSAHLGSLYRIDPSSGVITSRNGLQTANNSIGCFLGSVWCAAATAGTGAVYRFNPSTWPSAPIATITIGAFSPNSDNIVYDGSNVWVGTATGPQLARINPTLGSESLLSTPSFSGTEGSALFRSLTVDGSNNLWVQETNATYNLLKITGAAGSEAISSRVALGQAIVTVAVTTTAGKNVGDTVTITGGGSYIVQNVVDGTHFVLRNTFAGGNASVGTTIFAPASFT